jgi:hypothetical protein
MTEAEWRAEVLPRPMLEFVESQTTDRKRRLFAVACCRQVWTSLPGEMSRQAVDVAERFADGQASEAELAEANRNIEPITSAYSGHIYANPAHYATSNPVDTVFATLNASELVTDDRMGEYETHEEEIVWKEAAAKVDEIHSLIVRDIFGNPFRPIAVDQSWRTSTVVTLAEGIYQERAFDRLPILADALQDAGCDNEDVLNHCRSEGPHVRGCWVVDLLTGRK